MGTIVDNIILTDMPKMLEILKRNVERNRKLYKGNVSVKNLSWGETISSDFKTPFDLVIGSDITYEEEHTPALISTLLRLTNDKSEIYIGYEERKMGSENIFHTLIPQHFELVERIDVRNLHPAFKDFVGYILHLRRKQRVNRKEKTSIKEEVKNEGKVEKKEETNKGEFESEQKGKKEKTIQSTKSTEQTKATNTTANQTPSTISKTSNEHTTKLINRLKSLRQELHSKRVKRTRQGEMVMLHKSLSSLRSRSRRPTSARFLRQSRIFFEKKRNNENEDEVEVFDFT